MRAKKKKKSQHKEVLAAVEYRAHTSTMDSSTVEHQASSHSYNSPPLSLPNPYQSTKTTHKTKSTKKNPLISLKTKKATLPHFPFPPPPHPLLLPPTPSTPSTPSASSTAPIVPPRLVPAAATSLSAGTAAAARPVAVARVLRLCFFDEVNNLVGDAEVFNLLPR